jgi:hypothetical protein
MGRLTLKMRHSHWWLREICGFEQYQGVMSLQVADSVESRKVARGAYRRAARLNAAAYKGMASTGVTVFRRRVAPVKRVAGFDLGDLAQSRTAIRTELP